MTVQNITPTDRTIANYIEQYGNCNYDPLITDHENWQVFYHLSELRTGIISWYDFKKNAEVLEIGAGFGAVTGMLAKRCGHVTATERNEFRANILAKRYRDLSNLTICNGEATDLNYEKKFDYIILIGVLEKVSVGNTDKNDYVKYIKKLMDLLKEDGKLLIAVENRYGLRYLCGAVEPHTNKAFTGLNQGAGAGNGHSFSRQEIEHIIKESGLQSKFYYPLPDYKIPQLVYTDSYLPEKNLKERLIPYYVRKDTLIAKESELYDDVIENGVFPFVANSFFIECGKEDDFSDAVYAAISTDRGEERGFATVIHQKETVTKRPIYHRGNECAVSLIRNTDDLLRHGIPALTLQEEQCDGTGNNIQLRMEYVPYFTLSNYIKQVIATDKEKVLQIFDQLYQYILSSSETVPDSENKMLFHASETKREELKKMEFGPILKRAYIELIPLNCFYKEDKFLFFDQEFVKEDYPANYILFRAIYYMYCFTPNAEQYIPRSELLERYDLTATWDCYLEEEQLFLEEVRNHKQYKQFYRWTLIDENRISENARRLESEEEIIANYKISDKMKKMWKVELDILDAVDKLCKKHGIGYFIVHGTLLGAVRHKGFIPWDDDLDIAMLRKDYDRFLEVAEKEFEQPLSVHTYFSEKDTFFGGLTRIRNGNTTAIEEREIGHETNHGIWIDILPIDNCPEELELLEKKRKRIRSAQRLLLAKIYGKEFQAYADMDKKMWKVQQILSRLYSHKQLCQKLDRAMRLYNETETDYVAMFSGYDKHRQLLRKDFMETVTLDFENYKLPAPKGYENYLFLLMGKDYMKYPAEEERKPHHKGIFDAERSYVDYEKMLFDIFKDTKGKQIILFGAGMMFEDYMKKYGTKYRPSFVVDNDEHKWGRYKLGIEIRNPADILEVPASKRKIIICSYYYQEIEKQLQKMGIEDYQIYIQHIEWIVEAEKNR